MGRETNKARRQAQAQSVREKAAAARAQQQRADQRRRAILVISSIVVVAIIGGVITLVAINGKDKAVKSDPSTVAAVMKKVSSVPSATLDTVGAGSSVAGPQAIADVPAAAKPLTGPNNKPQLMYIGAEFCPYCAAERWAMAVALERFGNLDNVGFTASSSRDVYPNTATLDFKDATYTSKYLDFQPYEAEDRNSNPLQKVPTEANALWAALSAKYVQGGRQSFPFLDYGNKFVTTGPTFIPDKLKGLTQAQIADQLADPTTDVAKGVDGAANIITATLCNLTANQPAQVCSSSTIKTIQSQIAKGQNASQQPGSTS